MFAGKRRINRGYTYYNTLFARFTSIIMLDFANDSVLFPVKTLCGELFSGIIVAWDYQDALRTPGIWPL